MKNNEIIEATARFENMIAFDMVAPDTAVAFSRFVGMYRRCPKCRRPHAVVVFKADYVAYRAGGLLQDCFPYLSAPERELLKTGICEDCWNQIFGDDDED